MLLPLLFASCSDEYDPVNKIITVGSERIYVEEVGYVYWIKSDKNSKWELSYTVIGGLDAQYERGYEYVVEVIIQKVKDPIKDQLPVEYTLVRIISKEKKDSDIPHFTTNLSDIPDYNEVAFPEAKKELITLPNGKMIVKVDSLYIYQGDIVLNEEQVNSYFNSEPDTRSCISTNSIKYWTNHTVYYTFGSVLLFNKMYMMPFKSGQQKQV